MIAANYFDGQTARLHPVELTAGDDGLAVTGGAIARQYARAAVTVGEPFAQAPLVLYFADGSRCEVGDAGAGAGRALAEMLGYRKGAVERWQQRWYAALLALVLLAAAGMAIYTWGLPAAADNIAAAIPPALDQRLGATALAGLEGRMLGPSRLSEQRVAQVEQALRAIAPANTRVPIRLIVRSSPRLGANALALPDGTIVVTDAMILQILGKADDFDERQQAQLAGVLAHEIGHIQGRHSVRAMARSSLTTAASAALFGDFSAVAAGLPAVLLNMRYSREMESDADNYAISLLGANGISTAPLADLFDALEKEREDDPAHRLPRWLAAGVAYMDSHPASAERGERLRKAARP
jgi:Zn-dependent protease with chaperone function